MRPLLFILLALFQFALTACADDKTVIVPDFAISVRLSPQAEARLNSLHESIKVIATFDGDGEKVPGVKTAPHRDVFLGQAEREVNDKNIAEFKGEKISEKDYKRLFNKNYFVGITVVSARKVLPDNILACGGGEYHIESMREKTLEVKCSLIHEILK